MSTDITAQVEALCKKVNDLVELNEKKVSRPEGEKIEIEEKVKKLVAEAMAATPGANISRKTEFQATPSTKAEEVLAKMPVELQKQADECFIYSKLLKRPVQHLKSWARFTSEAGDFKKALDTAAAAGGGDWVPTDFSTNLYEHVRVNGKVAALFEMITMPTSPYVIPVEIGSIVTTKHAEQTADTGQTLITVGDSASITGKLTLTAAGHAARVLASKEVEEEMIAPAMPAIRKNIIAALAEGREDAILNGDSAGTHEDSDIGAGSADHRRRLWLGLRASSNDNSYKTDISTFSTTAIRNLRKSMGKYGVDPAKLAIITSISGYIQLLDLTEARTVDKLGAMATLLNGQLASFDGIPVIVSDQVRQDLNASGVYDGVTTTKTAVYLAYRGGWVMGERRGAQIQLLTELYAASWQDALIVKERVDFKPIYPTASNKTAWLGYNLTA